MMRRRCGPLWRGAFGDFRTDYIDVLVWHDPRTPEEVSNAESLRIYVEDEKGGEGPFYRIFRP